MNRFLRAVPLAVAALAPAAFAGTAQVRFIDPQKYDATGRSDAERADLDALARHVQRLAQARLPAGQVLKVDVLDISFAGTPVQRRDGTLLRVERGRADFPRMRLRYTVEQGGQVVRSGEDALAGLDYGRGEVSVRRNEPLYHEKRLLDHWFDEQVAPRHG